MFRLRSRPFSMLLKLLVPLSAVSLLTLPVEQVIAAETAEKLIDHLPQHAKNRYHHPDMAFDGKSVAFSVDASDFGRNTIWVHDLQIGSMHQLTFLDSSMSTGDVLVEWSPDGQFLAFASDRGGEAHLYMLPATGGEIKQLTRQPLSYNGSLWQCRFSWSPDGSQIAYTDGDSLRTGIFSLAVEDGSVTQHTDLSSSAVFPDWSPDGSSLVYVSDRDGRQEIWIHDIVSHEAKKVDTGMVGMAYPVWSPDGHWIAFQRATSRGFKSYFVNKEGGAVHQVGPEGDYGTWGPAWDSVDGLIFHAGENVDAPLVVYHLATQERQQVLKHFSAIGLVWGTWSNNSRQFTFSHIQVGAAGRSDTTLYLADIASGNLVQLPQPAVVDDWSKRQAPAWSPTDENLCYIVNAIPGGQVAIYHIASKKKRLITETPELKSECTWSHDGELLAYISGPESKDDIWIYDLVTQEELQLTFSGGRKSQLAFSPDDRHIAFMASPAGGKFGIYTVPTDGGEIFQRSDHTYWDIRPLWIDEHNFFYIAGGIKWSAKQFSMIGGTTSNLYASADRGVLLPFLTPDRKTLYYVESWGVGDLFKVNLATGSESTIIDNGVFRPLFAPDGSKAAFVNQEEQSSVSIWRQDVSYITRASTLP